MNRIGLRDVTGVASLVFSLLTTSSSLVLAGFSIFGKDYLRYADESILNFVYSTNFISIIGLATAAVAITFSLHISFSMRRNTQSKYFITEKSNFIEIKIPDANKTFTINLDDPKSISIKVQEIDKAVNQANI